MNAEIGEEPK